MIPKAEHEETTETRQERRELKLRKKREMMRQHGKGLSLIYKDVDFKEPEVKR